MDFQNKESNKGFTIIELLVVILVIGLLASMATFEYITQLQRGRDTTRINDLKGIAVALEMYRNDPANKKNVTPKNVHYPYEGSVLLAKTSNIDTDYLKNSIDPINDPNIQGYFTNIRQDPLIQRDTTRYYRYRVNLDGTEFKLSVKLEIDTNSMINDGGISQDWYEIFSEGGKNLPVN